MGVRSVRFDDDLFRRLRTEKNGTQVINDALRMFYEAQDKGLRLPTEAEEKEMEQAGVEEKTFVEPKLHRVGRKRGYGLDKFMIPVGDVIKYGVYRKVYDDGRVTYTRKPEYGAVHLAESRVWWCPQDKVKYVEELAEPFTQDGAFTFHVGEAGKELGGLPQMIEDDEDERKVGGNFTCNTKMVPALKSDVLVWLEINDAEKALAILDRHSALPCAVVCDAVRYAEDDVYRQAFDIANEYFIQYFTTGETVSTSNTPVSEEERLSQAMD